MCARLTAHLSRLHKSLSETFQLNSLATFLPLSLSLPSSVTLSLSASQIIISFQALPSLTMKGAVLIYT